MKHRKKTVWISIAASLLVTIIVRAQAPTSLPTPGDERDQELIVLLDAGPDTPTPRQVFESAQQNRRLPAGLDVGNPQAVRYVIPTRIEGAAYERLQENPHRPEALLQRYLVLSYPGQLNLATIELVLTFNPNVLFVGRNDRAELSVVIPNEPLFPATDVYGNSLPPGQHQWGSHALHLPEAWEHTTGHGYVAVIDTGIDVDHPDLRAFDSSGKFLGGNFRPHLSFDFGYDDTSVDEGEDQKEHKALGAGHGTHVAGIVAASTDNDHGVAGVCWDCSLIVSKVSRNSSSESNQEILTDDWVAGIHGSIERGAQVLNMSLGLREDPCTVNSLDPLCQAIQLATDRDLVIVAAAGNDGVNLPDWPASDSRVLGAAGLAPDGWFWNDCAAGGIECGSNFSADQFNTPAKQILSTYYLGLPWSPAFGCDSSLLPEFPGHGPCTGTSMASPYLAGSTALIRSVDPLLTKGDIENLLLTNVENLLGWDPQHGHGKPNVDRAVEDALGLVAGAVTPNRLTPLFGLYSFVAESHLYTSAPQMASAALKDPEMFFVTNGQGPPVGNYPFFPGARCMLGPCFENPNAAVYLFTTPKPPFPRAAPLVPLYRMSFEGPWLDNPQNRSFFYTTEIAGVESLRTEGYRLDGIEGYLYPRCTPEPSCIPTGAVRLYRLYNSDRDDWAIFPESELASFRAQGYFGQPGLEDWIGYVYPNVDTDGDDLIDGYERIVRTDPGAADSDCDGLTDGSEVLGYPRSDPRDWTCTPAIIGEVGRVDDLTHQVRTVVLSRSYDNPVVFAQPSSFNGGDTAVVRITSVQPDRFSFYIDEAPNKDGPHGTESVSYLVLEEGKWRLADGTRLEVGKITTNATVGSNVVNSWWTVTFNTSFQTTPASFSQVQTNNDPSWVKTRQITSSAISFLVALEEEEASTAAHGEETIGWLAIETAGGSWSGHRYLAGRTADAVTHDWFTIGTGGGFTDPAAMRFLASLATYDGGHSAGLRYRNLGTSGVEIKVEEDTTFDEEVDHTAEVVSFLFLEGNGQLSGRPNRI